MKPMLAGKVSGDWRLSKPTLVSPKLDGVRALIVDGVVMSRNMKPIPNHHVQDVLGHPELNGLDGELIVGSPTEKDVFRKTMSGVMSMEGEPDVRLFAFDSYRAPGGFQERNELVGSISRVARELGLPVEFVPHVLVRTHEELLTYEEEQLSLGYEGVMLRDPEGPYKHGRSTVRQGWLLALKRFVDAEAEIIGIEEQMENLNAATLDELGRTKRSSHADGLIPAGKMGSLRVRLLESGVEFRVGTGFSDWERHEIWLRSDEFLGKIIKVKYQQIGMKDKPRIPSFAGFRDPIDL